MLQKTSDVSEKLISHQLELLNMQLTVSAIELKMIQKTFSGEKEYKIKSKYRKK